MSSTSHRLAEDVTNVGGREEEARRRQHPGDQKEGGDINGEEVTDDEVEEFYAILRRINAAARYFKGGNDRVLKGGAGLQRRWRVSLEESIKQEVNGVEEGSKREEKVVENMSLDLNLSPLPH